MPAPQTEQENCVAHNGSLIPVPGRDIMVQAWYQGGVSVFDFTDSAQAGRDRVLRSRADRRQEPDHRRLLVDLLVQRPHLRLRDRPRHRRVQAEAERVPVAERDRRGDAWSGREEFNAQQQPKITWPASAVVGSRVRRRAEPHEGDEPERASAASASDRQRARQMRSDDSATPQPDTVGFRRAGRSSRGDDGSRHRQDAPGIAWPER